MKVMELRFAAFLFVCLLLTIPAVSAIRVSPSSTEVDTSAGYPLTFQFFVGNTEDEAIYIDIDVDGNLKDYITIDGFQEMIPAGESGKVIFTVDLPKDIEPGSYISNIRAVSKDVAEGGGIGFRLAVAHVVWFEKPFEGKHLKPNLVLRYLPVNRLDVTAQAISDGTESVEGAEISVIIYSPKGEVIKSFSGARDVEYGSSALINDYIIIDEPMQGEYRAVMNITYEGVSVSKEGAITIAQEEEEQLAGVKGIAAGITEVVAQPSSNTAIYVLLIIAIVLLALVLMKKRRQKKEKPAEKKEEGAGWKIPDTWKLPPRVRREDWRDYEKSEG